MAETMQDEGPSNDEVRRIWETNAPFWDDYFKEGNEFHLKLVAPAVERLLSLRDGETVLDIACGNGAFSRRLAALGAHVVAFDVSETFVERATRRSVEHAGRIDYQVIDATDRERLLTLGDARFDAAVCNMALMDMSNIEPLAQALPRLLKPNGRFVFSIMHPCFNQTGCRLVLEEEERDGEFVVTPAVKVVRYMTSGASQGIGIRGQPVKQYYFHRPLHELLRPFFDHGLALDGLEERAFELSTDGRPHLSWDRFPEIPPLLAVRLRRSATTAGDRPRDTTL